MSASWSVSVKGVIIWDASVVLLHNDRGEWELPGGRLEADETPEDCVRREIREELGVRAAAEQLLDIWVYEPVADQKVLIVTFGCVAERPSTLVVSSEHDRVGLFPMALVAGLTMPDGYQRSIRRWLTMRDGSRTATPGLAYRLTDLLSCTTHPHRTSCRSI